MGRLTNLLITERDTTGAYTDINGILYKKFSNKINLLRVLMMIETLKDTSEFPTKAKFETILSDKADETTIKSIPSLTRLYTPIVTGLKNGKTQKEMTSIKEKFYKVFFPVLLSGLDINLSSVKLKTVFSKSKHGVINKAQAAYILKIVKTIQNSSTIEFTQKDKIELMKMKDSFIEPEEKENAPSPEIPQNPAESKDDETIQSVAQEKAVQSLANRFKSKTPDEIKNKLVEFDTEEEYITSGKAIKESETEALEQEFDFNGVDLPTYTSAKFSFGKKKPELAQKINETRDRLQLQLDNNTFSPDGRQDSKIKKVITTLVADLVDSMSTHTPEFVGSSDLHPEITVVGDEIMLDMIDPNKSEDDFQYTRILKMGYDGGIDKITHKYFILPPESQGTGVSKETIANNLRTYKAAGINKIDLHANVGMGGYVWLRYGFKPDPDQLANITEGFTDIAKSISFGLKGGVMAGVSQQDATNGLVKQFKGTGLDTYILSVQAKFFGLPGKLKQIQNDLGFDDDFGDEKLVLNSSFNQVIGDEMEKIGKQLGSSFEINPDTIADDISLKSFDVKVGNSIKMEIDFSSKLASTPKRFHQKEADRIGTVLKSEIDPDIKVNKNGTATWTIKIDPITAKIPVKKWLTITGINVGEAGDKQAFPAGNDVTREVWSMNWKGSLDLNDPKQYNTALEYATIKKGEKNG